MHLAVCVYLCVCKIQRMLKNNKKNLCNDCKAISSDVTLRSSLDFKLLESMLLQLVGGKNEDDLL